MARLTVFFGVVLIVTGVVYWWLTGHTHPTALIATWFGLVLAICGAIAHSNDDGVRKLWMHLAVTIGLIGFLFPGTRVLIALFGFGKTLMDMAVQEQAVMAVVCLIFTLLCVQSFIAARRARTA